MAIKPPSTSENSLTPALSYYDTKARVKFIGSCLKQSTVPYNHRPIVNIYIFYELGASSSHNIEDRRSSFSFPGGGLVKMY